MKTKAVYHECPCQSGQSYAQCCQPLHQGNLADSALALMRSRYSAYVLGLTQYLLLTWHSDTRPTVLDLEADHIKWLGLEVLTAEATGPHTAMVEFVARYKVGGGRAERLHEVSEFIFTDAWYYVAGKHS
ncbi:MAG: hypothetical protein B7X95_01715 [Methylophilaceae bacterium 17-44-8]|nr:MAG: hypothetical protein B7X95_01715 [Methylophilaceae bacterium 17-44-8]